MNSSVAARLPLIHTSSHHQRVRALFFSSSDTGASSSPLPTGLSLAGAMPHTHDATRRALAHRLEPYSPKLVDEGPRGSILLIPSTLSTPYIRRVSEGSQKPFPWLSEGVRGMFTINTEAGEKACVPHLHGAISHVLVGRWCERISLKNFTS